jgi:hypothetical protein
MNKESSVRFVMGFLCFAIPLLTGLGTLCMLKYLGS